MAWNDRVLWFEGMFLQPQHFQQHDRYLERLLEGRAGPLHGNSWGFSRIEIDRTALALGNVQLTAATGILPDGTPFDCPNSDACPPALDISPDVRDELVVLALPMRRAGAMEAGDDNAGPDALTRFSVSEQEVVDASTASQANALIQIGRLRLRLALHRDTADAYTHVGVCRVRERRADNQLVLHPTYIPPMLDARADPLLASYIRDVHGMLHQHGEALATGLAHPGHGGVAEIADFLFLQTINRNELLFSHLGSDLLVHPERLFSRCLELAGELATFSDKRRRPIAFPAYQHDDLEKCFPPLINALREAFGVERIRAVVPIELQRHKTGARFAAIHEADLLKNARFVFSVKAQLPPDAVREQFPTHTKVASTERIRDLVDNNLPGIPLRPLSHAPREIPFFAGSNYFELERGGELWKDLERTGGLWMYIARDFPGLDVELWAIRG